MKGDEMTTGTKKPKWGVVNFKQIEARRKELSLPKSAMATNLGITNSTYHNWARGSTVPHPTQQDEIKAALDSMTGASTGETPRRKPGPKKGTRRESPERIASARETVAGGSIPMPSGFTPIGQSLHQSGIGQSVLGNDAVPIATITAAFISSQSSRGPVTKEVVFDFISGLQKALHPTLAPTVTPEATSTPDKVDEPAPASVS